MITRITPAIIVHMNKSVDAVLRDDARDHDDERARGSADLHRGAAEHGDDEAGATAQ
jgi:hypothetical protein